MIGRTLRRLQDERGLSVVELLVGMVFLGLIAAAFSMVFSSTLRHQSEIQEQSATQNEIRSGIDRLTRELRSAYVGGAGWPIESVSSSQITFTAPDRSTPFKLLRISYRVSGGTLQRAFYSTTNTGGPPWTWSATGTPTNWTTIARNITSATPFAYTDASNVATSTASAVRTVSLWFTFTTPTGNGRTYSYTASVTPRLGR